MLKFEKHPTDPTIAVLNVSGEPTGSKNTYSVNIDLNAVRELAAEWRADFRELGEDPCIAIAAITLLIEGMLPQHMVKQIAQAEAGVSFAIWQQDQHNNETPKGPLN